MPESVTDRPTKSHSYVFLLSKSARYFFDQEAVRERFDSLNPDNPNYRKNGKSDSRKKDKLGQGKPGFVAAGGKWKGENRGEEVWCPDCDGSGDGEEGEYGDPCERCGGTGLVLAPSAGRNIRSVWNIATQPYPEAHFATYPEELVRRCILAGTSERGCCSECGAPWVREVEREPNPGGISGIPGEPYSETIQRGKKFTGNAVFRHAEIRGWLPSCECGWSEPPYEDERPYSPIPCTVLDPFSGSGTTALVARKHGRKSIGIELSASYCALTARRLSQLSLLSEFG